MPNNSTSSDSQTPDETPTGPLRRIYKVTYTPVSLAGNTRGDQNAGSVLLRGAYLGLLGISAGDVKQMQLSLTQKQSALALSKLIGARSDEEYSSALKRVAKIPAADLNAISTKLASVRDASTSALAAAVREIDSRYTARQTPVQVSQPAAAPVAKAKSTAVSAKVESGSTLPPAKLVQGPPASAKSPVSQAVSQDALSVAFTAPALVTENLGAGVTARLANSVQWASVNAPTLISDLVKNFSLDVAGPSDLPNAISVALLNSIQTSIIANRVSDIVNSQLFDLAGLLHLERMVMTPLDTERGELLYSVPLSPEETVTLAHKEWTIVEEDFSRYIEDYLENYSETGVAQSSELTTTTATQQQRQDATSASLNSLSGQSVTVTAPIGTTTTGSTVDALASAQESVAQMRQTTSMASTRTIRDQKTSFTVTTTQGSQDWTARLLKNSRTDRTMMVDYYRRVRRWRTELYRYGVRLTYDIVVPHPGRRLWNIYQQVQSIQSQLAQAFVMPLDMSAITTGNWTALASSYHVALPPPPADQLIDASQTINYSAPGDNTQNIQLNVPANYQIDSLSFEIDSGVYLTGDRGAVMLIGPNVWNYVSGTAVNVDTGTVSVPLVNIPPTGPVNAVLLARNLDWGTVRVFAGITATDSAMNNWRQSCWAILREAALAVYQQAQDQLRLSLNALQRSIAAADTLSLRRIEREYIILACLEWLFPFLNLQSGWFSGINDTPTPLDRVAGFQESVLIKLMHTAIDWDSMLISLLPFFWERIDSSARVFVDHPDPLHREFLRAGAARIILPIVPGFEDQIISLFDLGYVGSAPGTNRYQELIDDVVAANAAYSGASHPASATGPDGAILPSYSGDYPVETGKLIGRWHDVMPTGALDMDVTFQPVAGA